nr:unnamed protein product [Digitaria exilis]
MRRQQLWPYGGGAFADTAAARLSRPPVVPPRCHLPTNASGQAPGSGKINHQEQPTQEDVAAVVPQGNLGEPPLAIELHRTESISVLRSTHEYGLTEIVALFMSCAERPNGTSSRLAACGDGTARSNESTVLLLAWRLGRRTPLLVIIPTPQCQRQRRRWWERGRRLHASGEADVAGLEEECATTSPIDLQSSGVDDQHWALRAPPAHGHGGRRRIEASAVASMEERGRGPLAEDEADLDEECAGGVASDVQPWLGDDRLIDVANMLRGLGSTTKTGCSSSQLLCTPRPSRCLASPPP